MTARAARRAVLAVAACGLLRPAAAGACAVCFGGADSAMTEGMNAGILVLLGCVALVQIGFIALFLTLRQRSRRLQERRDSLHLIRGGLP